MHFRRHAKLQRMISGQATPRGTATHALRYSDIHKFSWRTAHDLTLSTVGFGASFASLSTSEEECKCALVRAFEHGLNVVNCASQYRGGRAESVVGLALREALGRHLVTREEVFIIVKGGFIGEVGEAGTPHETVEEHCLHPEFLEEMLHQSRQRIGIEMVDAFLLHNPETQLPFVGKTELQRRMTDAFRALERCADRGTIGCYGVATWHALRVPPEFELHLSLEILLECARAAGGDRHRFRVLELPLNLALPEMLLLCSQRHRGQLVTPLDAAQAAGCIVLTSAPLCQGQLVGRIPVEIGNRMPGLLSDAQRCLQFARSPLGISSTICGMSTVAHVDDACSVALVPPLDAAALASLLGRAQ